MFFCFFFFFQAEDGIRDVAVTGVQTCALPIFPSIRWRPDPAAECWSMLRLGYSELSWDHSASAKISTSPYRSKALLASPMHLVGRILTRADDYNHSARKLQPSRLLLPTLLGLRLHFLRI